MMKEGQRKEGPVEITPRSAQRRSGPAPRLAALLAASVLAAAGCGGDGNSSPAGSGSPAQPSSSTPGGTTRITVDESEFKLGLSPMVLRPGRYIFLARNTGHTTHALEIEGPGLEAKTDNISPGQSASVTVTLKQGRYELYCPVDGHKQRGMEMHVSVS
jgi:plastocyanin